MVFYSAVRTTLFVRTCAADFTGGLTSISRRRGLKSSPTQAIFILIIISFTAATAYWAVTMSFVTIQIRSMLVKNVGMELSEKGALTDAITAKLGIIQVYLFPVMVL